MLGGLLELEGSGSRRGVGSSCVLDPQPWWEVGLWALGPLLPLMPLGVRTLALLLVLPKSLFQPSFTSAQDIASRTGAPILQKIKLRHREVK